MLKEYTRRGFLKFSALAAGGLAACVVSSPDSSPEKPTAPLKKDLSFLRLQEQNRYYKLGSDTLEAKYEPVYKRTNDQGVVEWIDHMGKASGKEIVPANGRQGHEIQTDKLTKGTTRYLGAGIYVGFGLLEDDWRFTNKLSTEEKQEVAKRETETEILWALPTANENVFLVARETKEGNYLDAVIAPKEWLFETQEEPTPTPVT